MTNRVRLLIGMLSLLMGCGFFEDGGGGSSSGSGGAAPAASAPAADPGDPGNPAGAAQGDPIATFAATVHPLLTENCLTCHAGQGPGTPHIASIDVATAYSAVVDQGKVNFAMPDSSRLVRRLAVDFHHCWSDCTMDGAEMLAAIELWDQMMMAASDPGSGGNPGGNPSNGGNPGEAIASETLTFADGVLAEGAQRVQQDVVALYEFKEGQGDVARDTSGVAPAMDLALEGPTWIGNGIAIETGRAIATAAASRKLYDEIADPANGTQSYSIEAWVVPANTDQEGPARIVSYSSGTQQRNFTLGQVLYYYDYRNRTAAADVGANGTPSLRTATADEDLQARLQHVVVTYDPAEGRRIYVDGMYTDDPDRPALAGNLDWNPNYTFLLANETTNNRLWQGQIQLVAIHKSALNAAQIVQNFTAGVGQKLVMRFDVSRWLAAGSYVEFTVSELDGASYLFCQPTLVTTSPPGSRIANLRIKVNGQTPVSGQAFVNVETLLGGSSQELSGGCSVISKDQGPDNDLFAIEFEALGGSQNPVVAAAPGSPPPRVFGDPMPSEGVRNFDRINETMAAVTGVSARTMGPEDTFLELRQQLPVSFDLRSFASSQQVAISKLSLEYCDALVETPNRRDAVFDTNPQFEFDQPIAVSLSNAAKRDRLVDPLVDRMVGVGLANQPTPAELRSVLDTMIDALTANCNAATCDAERTRTVAKATCAAVLSSAAVSVH